MSLSLRRRSKGALCRSAGGLFPAALLVFFPAAAGTGIVPSDFRFGPDKGFLRDHFAVIEEPFSVVAAEFRNFMVFQIDSVVGIAGDEFNGSVLILFPPAFAADDFQPLPFGLFRPFPDFLSVIALSLFRMGGIQDMVDFRFCVC